MTEDTAAQLLRAARLMLHSLDTERSDIAWQNTSAEDKAAQYDRACAMLKAAIIRADREALEATDHV